MIAAELVDQRELELRLRRERLDGGGVLGGVRRRGEIAAADRGAAVVQSDRPVEHDPREPDDHPGEQQGGYAEAEASGPRRRGGAGRAIGLGRDGTWLTRCEQADRDHRRAEGDGDPPRPIDRRAHGRSRKQCRRGDDDGPPRAPLSPRGEDREGERRHRQREPRQGEIGEHLEEERMRVAGDGGRLGMRVPVELVVTCPDAAHGSAAERVDRRLPELRPAAATGGEQASRARHRGLAGGVVRELPDLFRGIREHDGGDDRRCRGDDDRSADRPPDRNAFQPAVEPPPQETAGGARGQRRPTGHEPLVPLCGVPQVVDEVVLVVREHRQPRGRQAPERHPGHQPRATLSECEEHRDSEDDRQDPPARRRKEQGQAADRHQPDGGRATGAGLGGRPEPGKEDEPARHAGGEPVPVPDRVAETSLRAERRRCTQGVVRSEEPGMQSGRERERGDARRARGEPDEPGPRSSDRARQDNEEKQSGVRRGQKRGGERPARVVRPRHRDHRQEREPGEARDAQRGGARRFAAVPDAQHDPPADEDPGDERHPSDRRGRVAALQQR